MRKEVIILRYYYSTVVKEPPVDILRAVPLDIVGSYSAY